MNASEEPGTSRVSGVSQQVASAKEIAPWDRDALFIFTINLYTQLYKEITNQLDLAAVCSHFASVRFYSGVVDLALTAASKRDPQDLALHFYRNNEPPEDVLGSQAFAARYVTGQRATLNPATVWLLQALPH